MEISIRMASPDDGAALSAIYAPYVEWSAVSFEYEPPTAEEFSERIRKVLTRYPYLVAEEDGVPVGYAYASAFHSRPAYGWAAECSIYVKWGCRRGGVGRKLYERLETLLRQQNVINLYACIAYPNPDSVAFHTAMGYQIIGRFNQCGYKLNRWWDMVWMEKMIGPHPERPEPVVSIGEIE